MKRFLLALSVLFVASLHAQRVCNSQGKPSYTAATGAFPIVESVSGINGTMDNNAPAGVIRIPVIVHVLYQNPSQNISDEQIKSGIAALNRDFRRRNADTVNTPARFKALTADVAIEFALAVSDPKGAATNGIVRKYTPVKEWTIDDKIKSSKAGGDDPWDANQYLNIWIGNMPRTLGYSSMPGDAGSVDGIAIHTANFGTIGKRGAYNMGRTLVHEAGHWLGLKHIWGDAACGDDGIDDTPKQGGFTSGCPNNFLSSCNNGTQGDMYMNYMDFTNDACMNMFTRGQKQKMRSQFVAGGPRRSLLSSKGLDAPTLFESPVATNPPAQDTTVAVPAAPGQSVITRISVYPNPATSWIQVELPDASWLGKELRVIGTNGILVKQVNISSLQQKISLAGLSTGMYLLRGDNGNGRIAEKLLIAASGQ